MTKLILGHRGVVGTAAMSEVATAAMKLFMMTGVLPKTQQMIIIATTFVSDVLCSVLLPRTAPIYSMPHLSITNT